MTAASATRSTSFAPAVVLGSTEPRIWTPPLRELTPDTSYGYEVIDFARDVLDMPLDPWQEWAAIHLGELLPDGRPRFRTVLIIVSRQHGKTLLAKVLILYWLFVECVPTVLGTSTDRSYAKRTWGEVRDLAMNHPMLSRRLGPKPVRLTIGEESLVTAFGAEYTFAANNRRAGRSMTLHRWVCDELREHADRDCWDAASNAMNAVASAQAVCITNQGDDRSIVLDSLRTDALAYLDSGEGDVRLGLFEWSAPNGSDPTDLAALAMAGPNLGRPGRVDPDAILGAAMRAKRAGGEELARFRTEVMCVKVDQLDPAIDPDAWLKAGTDEPINLAEHRDRLVLAYDVSLDGAHVTVVAAALIDGKVHVEGIASWSGFACTKTLRLELPALVDKIRPRAVANFENGPAAAVSAELAQRKGNRLWPPRRVQLIKLDSEQPAACMGLAEVVAAGQLVHPRDELLSAHVRATQKRYYRDRWVLERRGSAPIDAAYALAAAVHAARTLPPPRPEITLV